jgi:hypothetical protein
VAAKKQPVELHCFFATTVGYVVVPEGPPVIAIEIDWVDFPMYCGFRWVAFGDAAPLGSGISKLIVAVAAPAGALGPADGTGAAGVEPPLPPLQPARAAAKPSETAVMSERPGARIRTSTS